MKYRSLFAPLTTIFALLLFLAGCSNSSDDAQHSFQVAGYVEEIDGQRIVIDHEEIPDYMPAMVMPFRIKVAEELPDVVPGDQIRFTYQVTTTESWIEDIERTGLRREPSDINAITGTTGLLSTGDTLPDYAFIDQNGRNVKLSDFRGQVVAMTFIFTRCPVPEYCPAMMRNFGAVEQTLENHPEAPANWQLLTLTFDPEYDTPERMKAYGEAFSRKSDRWQLLTSSSIDPIEGIAKNVGLKFGKKNGSYLHNLRTVVLDPDGRITKVFTDETWSPEELVEEMVRQGSNSR